MWALILFSLLLGCLFLYLAVRSFLRRQEWRNAVRLNARVAEVQYREARRKGDIIDDGRSSAVVTLRFFHEGREWTEQKEYQGIVGTPTCGQTVPICLNQGNRTWAPWREVRSYWGLLLALSVLCLQITAALLIDGRGILAALSDFQVESPNLPGSLFLAMIGAILAACAYAQHLYDAADDGDVCGVGVERGVGHAEQHEHKTGCGCEHAPQRADTRAGAPYGVVDNAVKRIGDGDVFVLLFSVHFYSSIP